MNEISSLHPVYLWMLVGIGLAFVGIIVTSRGNKKLDRKIADLKRQRREKSVQPG